jgi:hypothetical protein
VTETPSFITVQDVRLVVILRGNRFGIRMWDNHREERQSFPARTWFEVDEDFCISAHYTTFDRQKMAFFPDLTGEKSECGRCAFDHLGSITSWSSSKRMAISSSLLPTQGETGHFPRPVSLAQPIQIM